MTYEQMNPSTVVCRGKYIVSTESQDNSSYFSAMLGYMQITHTYIFTGYRVYLVKEFTESMADENLFP